MIEDHLTTASTARSEVVVIGYLTVKKNQVTKAISSVNQNEFTNTIQ